MKMTENSKLADMVSDDLNSVDDFGGQKISVTNHVNCLQHSGTKSDSFVVDMERFSHLIEKEINSKPRVTLQRSLSRKVSIRNGERDTNIIANSPRAALNGIGVPEKATVVASGGPDHSSNHHHHHQITITTGSTAAAEIKPTLGKKPSFRRSSSNAFAINPRRLLLFFATLSCMGTIVLIYFTLSMAKEEAATLD